METSASASFTTMNVPPHTSEQNRSARSARTRLLKIFPQLHAKFDSPLHLLSTTVHERNDESKHPANLPQRRKRIKPAAQPAIMSESETDRSLSIDAPSGIVETSLIGVPTHVATNSCDFLHLCHALDSARHANAGRQTRRLGRSALAEFHHRQQCRRKAGAQDRNPVRADSHPIPRWTGRRARSSQSPDHCFRPQG